MPPMTDTYEQIVHLRAIRQFAETPVDDGDLGRVLEAARWTGSSKNNQDWAFVVVTGEQKEALAEAGRFSRPLRDAPMGIALVKTPGGYDFDIGRAAQNIMLGADAIGMVTCPVTLHNEKRAGEVLGLPDGHHSRYAVALGYPSSDSAPAHHGGRKPLEELVHHERF